MHKNGIDIYNKIEIYTYLFNNIDNIVGRSFNIIAHSNNHNASRKLSAFFEYFSDLPKIMKLEWII